MSLQSRISRLDKLDLEHIWEYTARTWSEEQADKYFHLLLNGIETICLYPEIGRSLEGVKQGQRVLEAGKQLIIYKLKNKEVFIDRILHIRMNIKEKTQG